MRVWVVACTLLVAACGQGVATAAKSPSASIAPSAIASPAPSGAASPSTLASAATPTLSPSASVPPTAVSTGPGGRSLAAVAYDQSHSAVVIFGGQGKPSGNAGFDYLGDTGAWASSGWPQGSA